jgi:hypothetical protein
MGAVYFMLGLTLGWPLTGLGASADIVISHAKLISPPSTVIENATLVITGGKISCVLKEQLGNLALADLVEYPKTLTKLQNLHLGYTTIIAGHWSPIHGIRRMPRRCRSCSIPTLCFADLWVRK